MDIRCTIGLPFFSSISNDSNDKIKYFSHNYTVTVINTRYGLY